MRVLILGGTGFLGTAVTRAFRGAGHQVALLNRGRTDGRAFPDLELFVADRSGPPPSALAGRTWDCVVDLSAFSGDHVDALAGVLGRRVGRYLLVSSRSVYDWARCSGPVAEDAVLVPPDPTGAGYAGGKVAAEQRAAAAYGARLTIVRPGVIVGPGDRSDRFTWWVRAARYLTVPPPRIRENQPVQVIDVEDVAAFVRGLGEAGMPGIFNAAGPRDPIDLAGLFAACRRAALSAGSPSDPDPALGVPPDAEVRPLVSATERDDIAHRCDVRAALGAGLSLRSVEESAAAVGRWDADRGHPPLAPLLW